MSVIIINICCVSYHSHSSALRNLDGFSIQSQFLFPLRTKKRVYAIATNSVFVLERSTINKAIRAKKVISEMATAL